MGCCRGLQLLRIDVGAFPEVQLLCQGVAAEGKQPAPGVSVACTQGRDNGDDDDINTANCMSLRWKRKADAAR